MKVLIFSIILTVNLNGFPVYEWKKTGEMRFNSIAHLESFLSFAHQESDSFVFFDGSSYVFRNMDASNYEKKSSMEAARIIWAGGQISNASQTVYYRIEDKK